MPVRAGSADNIIAYGLSAPWRIVSHCAGLRGATAPAAGA